MVLYSTRPYIFLSWVRLTACLLFVCRTDYRQLVQADSDASFHPLNRSDHKWVVLMLMPAFHRADQLHLVHRNLFIAILYYLLPSDRLVSTTLYGEFPFALQLALLWKVKLNEKIIFACFWSVARRAIDGVWWLHWMTLFA